jgi:uncharacterized membrane protein YeaQ/YmgE (transglycosylase-associated protein family)
MDEPVMGIVDPHEEIARLEAQIEQLAGRIEGCRKFMLASRIAIGLGGALIAAILFGLMVADPLAMTAAITAVLGGIVLLGSNSSTAKDAAEEMAEAEAERASLIGSIELRVVGGRETLH